MGVVLCAPKSGYFDYIIEQRRFKRLTEFFTELPRDLPKNATQYIANELERVKEYSFRTNQDSLKRIFWKQPNIAKELSDIVMQGLVSRQKSRQ